MHHGNDSMAFPGKGPHGHLQVLLTGQVQKGGRFIEEHHLRVLVEQHRQIGFLPLSAGQFCNGAVCQIHDSRPLQSPVGQNFVIIGIGSRPGNLRKPPMHDQTPYTQGWNRVFLGQQSGSDSALFHGNRLQVPAIPPHLSLHRPHQSHAQGGEGGLAGAVGANDHREFPRLEGGGDVMEHRFVTIACCHVVQLNHVHVLFPSRAATGSKGRLRGSAGSRQESRREPP